MLLPFFVFLLASFIGGSLNPLFVRFGTYQIPPITLTMLRVIGSSLFLFPLWYKNKQIVSLPDMVKLLPFGLNLMFFSIGQQFTSVIMGQILYTLVPILVAVFGYLLINEKISKPQIIGLLISICGVGVLLNGSIKTQDIFSLGKPQGNFLILTAVFCFSFYTVALRSLNKKYSSITVLFFSFIVASIFLSIVAPFEWRVRPIHFSVISYIGWGSLLGLILLSSIAFYYLYQWLVKHTSAFIGSLIVYGGVVFGSLSGAIVFHERFTTTLIIGGFLVLSGVFLANTYTRFRKNKKAVIK